MASKSEDSVVKIDSELLNEVEEFINLDENKFRYANKKQFIDLAVIDFFPETLIVATSLFSSSICCLNLIFLRFRTISVTSSMTPSIVENS